MTLTEAVEQATLRDALLPRLVSGELVGRVQNAVEVD